MLPTNIFWIRWHETVTIQTTFALKKEKYNFKSIRNVLSRENLELVLLRLPSPSPRSVTSDWQKVWTWGGGVTISP